MKKYKIRSGINCKLELLGDSHRYETTKGIISLIHPCIATLQTYEIYCIKGELFENTERFDTLKEAETRIKELLNN